VDQSHQAGKLLLGTHFFEKISLVITKSRDHEITKYQNL
jgi:hypothetical protein